MLKSKVESKKKKIMERKADYEHWYNDGEFFFFLCVCVCEAVEVFK